MWVQNGTFRVIVKVAVYRAPQSPPVVMVQGSCEFPVRAELAILVNGLKVHKTSASLDPFFEHSLHLNEVVVLSAGQYLQVCRNEPQPCTVFAG